MPLRWLFNGTIEARHLGIAYLAVWIIQGGYAAWIAWQWTHTRTEDPPPPAPRTPATAKPNR